MRISNWSSDVCSSDLRKAAVAKAAEEAATAARELEGPSTPLFGAFADSYIDTHEEGWRNPKHRQQWRNTIKTHAKPLLVKPVDAITADDVLAILTTIWNKIPAKAGRLRGRTENNLDAAKARSEDGRGGQKGVSTGNDGGEGY